MVQGDPVCLRETLLALPVRVYIYTEVRRLNFIDSHVFADAHSSWRPASSRTLVLSHVTPAFWQLEHLGYSLSHCIHAA